jgi:predicted amidohydrolase
MCHGCHGCQVVATSLVPQQAIRPGFAMVAEDWQSHFWLESTSGITRAGSLAAVDGTTTLFLKAKAGQRAAGAGAEDLWPRHQIRVKTLATPSRAYKDEW